MGMGKKKTLETGDRGLHIEMFNSRFLINSRVSCAFA